MAGGSYDPTKPAQGNSVRGVDLPAMRANYEVLADLVSSVERGGPTAPSGHLFAVHLAGSGAAAMPTSGLATLRVSGASGAAGANASRAEFFVHDGGTDQRLAWYTAASGSAGYLKVPSTPLSADDVATKGYVDAEVAGLASALDDLTDVNTAGVVSGDALVYDGAGWVPGEGGVTDHGLLTGLADDDHTQYVLADGTRGFSAPVSGHLPTTSGHLVPRGYIDTLNLSGLADVDEASPASGEVLTWNGTTWTPEAASVSLGFVGALYGLSGSSVNVSNNDVEVALTWSGSVYDTDGFWNTANPTRLTVQRDGKYMVAVGLDYGDDTQAMRATIRVNGVSGTGTVSGLAKDDASYSGGRDSDYGHTLNSAPISLASGDYLEVWVKNCAGGAAGSAIQNIARSSYTYFSVFKVGDTAGGDHGDLTGLADDDHTQYLANSSIAGKSRRTMSGAALHLYSGATDGVALCFREDADGEGKTDATTGWYRSASGCWGFASVGVPTLDLASARVRVHSGAVGTPGLAFIGDTNTGLYASAADEVSVALGGVQEAKFATSGMTVNGTVTCDDPTADQHAVTLGYFNANAGVPGTVTGTTVAAVDELQVSGWDMAKRHLRIYGWVTTDGTTGDSQVLLQLNHHTGTVYSSVCFGSTAGAAATTTNDGAAVSGIILNVMDPIITGPGFFDVRIPLYGVELDDTFGGAQVTNKRTVFGQSFGTTAQGSHQSYTIMGTLSGVHEAISGIRLRTVNPFKQLASGCKVIVEAVDF
jgi:hypothetical protein